MLCSPRDPPSGFCSAGGRRESPGDSLAEWGRDLGEGRSGRWVRRLVPHRWMEWRGEGKESQEPCFCFLMIVWVWGRGFKVAIKSDIYNGMGGSEKGA